MNYRRTCLTTLDGEPRDHWRCCHYFCDHRDSAAHQFFRRLQLQYPTSGGDSAHQTPFYRMTLARAGA
jgi:hypothetical protein